MPNDSDVQPVWQHAFTIDQTQRLAMQEIVLAINRFMDDLAAKIAPVLVGVTEVVTKIGELLWEEYRKAGQPYGETEEGMWQWAKQQLLTYDATESTEFHFQGALLNDLATGTSSITHYTPAFRRDHVRRDQEAGDQDQAE